MNSIAQRPTAGKIAVGVDTHKYVHVAVAIDELGGRLGEITVSVDSSGYCQLERWAMGFGEILAFGIEGTGSYGAGITGFVRRHGHRVIEVNRPDRRDRRLNGKSDALDAESAGSARWCPQSRIGSRPPQLWPKNLALPPIRAEDRGGRPPRLTAARSSDGQVRQRRSVPNWSPGPSSPDWGKRTTRPLKGPGEYVQGCNTRGKTTAKHSQHFAARA